MKNCIQYENRGSRNRRQVEAAHNLNEDGVPIVDSSYVGNEGINTAGLRIYDAFFQHRRDFEIPHDPKINWENQWNDPIRPHHRYLQNYQINYFKGHGMSLSLGNLLRGTGKKSKTKTTILPTKS